MLRKTILTIAMASVSTLTLAGHDSKPTANPWTNFGLENKLQSMPKGDPIRGEEVHTQMMCNACHGEKGESPSRNYASLNGQPSEYTIKMMLDYQDGRRWEDYKQANVMVKISRALDEQQIADVAAFYAQQSLNSWSYAKEVDQEMFAKMDRVVRKGDVSRMIVPCASCHGAKGEGNGIVPALAGQVPEYFIRTMKAYQGKHRNNDVNEGMSQFTHKLTDAEIEALAEYYAALGQAQ